MLNLNFDDVNFQKAYSENKKTYIETMDEVYRESSPASPPGLERHGGATGATPPCWPVSGLVDATSIVFPNAC
jgi:hypothetical protein